MSSLIGQYTEIDVITSSGSWVAPDDCYEAVIILLAGAGGGKGGGGGGGGGGGAVNKIGRAHV